ncbi:unnamed protein product [Ambrosiozyma monospora]|uniref:Unnamed protein product n=1 Tax=Ambrosiozyma monospora TaxID=43982 RepID=A0A9W6YS65_AMBMO|nr:unnamed protein product [Ambrosiozyma monospora]
MQVSSSNMLSIIGGQEPVESHTTEETANSVSLSSGDDINNLSTNEEATEFSDFSIMSIKSTDLYCGCSSATDTNGIISQLVSDYDLSVSTYPSLLCSNTVSSNSPKTFNLSSGSLDSYKGLAGPDYNNITIDIDDGFDGYFRTECELQEYSCSVSTVDPVLCCTFEEALQNIFHPVSPTASLYDQLDHTPSGITECKSSMVTLFPLSACTPESDYDYSIKASLPIDREAAFDLDYSASSSATATPTISCNCSHKDRKQVWNKLTRWWHRKITKGKSVNEDSTFTNAEVKDKGTSAFATMKVDIENDDHQSIGCSSCDIFEHIDCTSSNASSLALSAKYSLDNGTLEDDDHSPSVSSSMVAKRSDDDYSPLISSSLVAEQDDDEIICLSNKIHMIGADFSLDDDDDAAAAAEYDNSSAPSISSSLVAEQGDDETLETLYFSNKGDMIGSNWLTMQTYKTSTGYKKTKTMLLGSWSDLLSDKANHAYITTWTEIDENILKN